ncbi:transcriptional regulator [Brevibacillus centrosporus]|uniref:LexA family protein n=1 Tax=Brevibacillus centrosporus TaxID=54910 RepID=UPI002E23E15B|nr:transcriptional regulator [Brevibacillus centrosporus]
MKRITSKQRAVLKAILDFTEKHKYAPTVRELTDMVGLKSSSTMHGYLERLKLLGLITWEPSSSRTITVTEGEGIAV